MNNEPIDPTALENAVDVACENCKGHFFDQAVALKKISAIDPNNTTGQAQVMPIGVFVCRNCGAPLLDIE